MAEPCGSMCAVEAGVATEPCIDCGVPVPPDKARCDVCRPIQIDLDPRFDVPIGARVANLEGEDEMTGLVDFGEDDYLRAQKESVFLYDDGRSHIGFSVSTNIIDGPEGPTRHTKISATNPDAALRAAMAMWPDLPGDLLLTIQWHSAHVDGKVRTRRITAGAVADALRDVVGIMGAGRAG